MIDIIIPAYNAIDFISNALNSILIQTFKDRVKVCIVDDCSNQDYSIIINEFKSKLQIKTLRITKNSGPGFARQYGLDNTNCQYVIFLDSDDMFYGGHAVENLYNNIKNYDVVVSNFIEETYDNKIITHKYNFNWLHGKIFDRNFLTKNNIRFNETYSNEDVGFNTLVELSTNNINYIDVTTYIWKCNKNSITRKNRLEFEFTGLEGFIFNKCWAIKEAQKNKIDGNKIAYVAYESLLEIYYNYIKFFKRKDRNKILKWSSELKKIYLKYEKMIDKRDKKAIEYEIIQKGLYLADSDAILNNNTSFKDFLRMIG